MAKQVTKVDCDILSALLAWVTLVLLGMNKSVEAKQDRLGAKGREILDQGPGSMLSLHRNLDLKEMALAFPLLFPSCKEAWDSLSYSEKEIQKQCTVRVAECPALKVLGRSISRLKAEDGR